MAAKIFVTGAASGIGRAIALAHAERGDRVIAADLSADALDALVDCGIEPWVMDVADHRGVEKAAGQIWTACGGIDRVYSNAGIGASVPLLKATPDQFRKCFDVNLIGAWAVLRAFAARMVEAGRPGRLCVTGSEHSLGFQSVGGGVYTASKHAVLGLADVLRHELPASISVSVLCPGLTATGIGTSKDASPRANAVGSAIMGEGIDPAIVARVTLDGVDRGDFIITSHAASRLGWDQRVKDVESAFDRVPEEGRDIDQYAVPAVVERVLARMKPKD